MSIKVSQMTDFELRQMVGEIVEEKLLALLGDDEEDFPFRQGLKKRLLKQIAEVRIGKQGEALEKVVSRLGLGYPCTKFGALSKP